MKLNRRARRAAKSKASRPTPADSPAQQMKKFLKAPGKVHIVQLPDEKSFVVKVTDDEMPLFLTICQQLRGVLGYCDAIPATPVEASVATTQQIAESSAASTKRVRLAQQRQENHDKEGSSSTAFSDFTRAGKDFGAEYARAFDELGEARRRREADEQAARSRHPAGRKSGRHRAPEPDTAFDRLVAAGPVDNEDGARRLMSMEIAAAHDNVARKQAELDAANEQLRDAVDRGGELHNRYVTEQFTERAGERIAQAADTPDEPGACPAPQIDDGGPPLIIGQDIHATVRASDHKHVNQVESVRFGIDADLAERRQEAIEDAQRLFDYQNSRPMPLPDETVTVQCAITGCPWEASGPDREQLRLIYGAHIDTHRHTAGLPDAGA